MKENNAQGRVDAPILIMMMYPLSPRMAAWFWKVLLGAGIQKTDTRVVYMLDEPPAGANNKPTAGQLRSAADRVQREITASQPKVIVPMGSEALLALTGIRENIFESRGFIIRDDLFRSVPLKVRKQVGVYKRASKATGAKAGDPRMGLVTEEGWGLLGQKFDGIVIPTFSADYIRIERFAPKPAFKEDMKRARRAVDGDLYEVGTNMLYFVDQHNMRRSNGDLTISEMPFEAALRGDIISVDIETHGVDNEVIDTVQISDGTVTGCFAWSENVRLMTERIFARDAFFIVHNSTFDIPRLQMNGVYISQETIDTKVFCSMMGAVNIQPDLHKGLGRCATVYLDVTPWKWESLKTEKPEVYAAKDALVTNHLGRIEIMVMQQLGIWNLFMGRVDHPGPGVMATMPELELMTKGGLLLDRTAALKWTQKLEKKLLRYTKLWMRMFPDTPPSSNPSVSKLLYGEWWLPVQRNRYTEGISVDELSLITLSAFVRDQRANPAIAGWRDDPRAVPRTFDLLLKIRDTKKTLTTYVLPAAENLEARVHPRYLPVSKDDERGAGKLTSRGNTSTGRLASSGPNIQNQPKIVRSLYIPDRMDWSFIQADYKSAELYVLAGMSGDKRLMSDLNSGDMHQLNADRFGIERKIAKNVTYASQYLASPGKQSEMILEQAHTYVSPAECSRISTSIWGHYTDATAYKQHLVDLCDTKKFIRNPFGRVRFFHDGNAPAAVNFIPQSTVADILWCVLKPVAEIARKHGGRMVTTVHDSILVAVPTVAVPAAAAEIKRAMEKRFDCIAEDFFIPVELEVAEPGLAWSAVKPYTLEAVNA